MDEMKMNDRVVFSEGEAYYDEDATAKSNEQEINISVLGAGGVGKSALTLRFVREFFVQDWEPTIEDAYRKVVDVDDRPCTLSVLDTAGQEDVRSLSFLGGAGWGGGQIAISKRARQRRLTKLKPTTENATPQFESLRHQWLMDKDAIIFVYAINSRQSLDELDAFYQLYRHIHGESKKVPIILVANKKDLANLDPKQREVTTFQGQVKAQEYGGATHIEASAATGENVTFVFESLVRAVRTAKTKEKKALPSKCNIL